MSLYGEQSHVKCYLIEYPGYLMLEQKEIRVIIPPFVTMFAGDPRANPLLLRSQAYVC